MHVIWVGWNEIQIQRISWCCMKVIAELLKQEIKLICRILQGKMSNKARSCFDLWKQKKEIEKKQKTIVTKLPDKKLRFQLSPCYIPQKRLGADQHYVIPAPTIPKKKKNQNYEVFNPISTKPIEHKKANSGKPTLILIMFVSLPLSQKLKLLWSVPAFVQKAHVKDILWHLCSGNMSKTTNEESWSKIHIFQSDTKHLQLNIKNTRVTKNLQLNIKNLGQIQMSTLLNKWYNYNG